MQCFFYPIKTGAYPNQINQDQTPAIFQGIKEAWKPCQANFKQALNQGNKTFAGIAWTKRILLFDA